MDTTEETTTPAADEPMVAPAADEETAVEETPTAEEAPAVDETPAAE